MEKNNDVITIEEQNKGEMNEDQLVLIMNEIDYSGIQFDLRMKIRSFNSITSFLHEFIIFLTSNT